MKSSTPPTAAGRSTPVAPVPPPQAHPSGESRTRKKYDDPPWLARLVLPGRGSWKGARRPFMALAVGGSEPYLNLVHGEDEEYLLSLSHAEARRLAAFLVAHFGGPDV